MEFKSWMRSSVKWKGVTEVSALICRDFCFGVYEDAENEAHTHTQREKDCGLKQNLSAINECSSKMVQGIGWYLKVEV